MMAFELSGLVTGSKKAAELYLANHADCPFCAIDPTRILFADAQIFAFWDAFPVSAGHVLIVPRRHMSDWDDLEDLERGAVWAAVDRAMAEIRIVHGADGFNVGFNHGAVAGQTGSTFICM